MYTDARVRAFLLANAEATPTLWADSDRVWETVSRAINNVSAVADSYSRKTPWYRPPMSYVKMFEDWTDDVFYG